MGKFCCNECTYKCIIEMTDKNHPPGLCPIDGNNVKFRHIIAAQQVNPADAEKWCGCHTPAKQWGSGFCLTCGKELHC